MKSSFPQHCRRWLQDSCITDLKNIKAQRIIGDVRIVLFVLPGVKKTLSRVVERFSLLDRNFEHTHGNISGVVLEFLGLLTGWITRSDALTHPVKRSPQLRGLWNTARSPSCPKVNCNRCFFIFCRILWTPHFIHFRPPQHLLFEV